MEQYQMARKAWVGDYPDPNTFLDMWVTDNPQSNTNWSNAEYDRLITQASTEQDPANRMAMLRNAETLLATELPVIPIYFYTSSELAKSNIDGFAPPAQDLHPLQVLRFRSDSECSMRDATGYLLKRSLWMILTLWAVYTVSFVLMRSVPGNPFAGDRNIPPSIERQLKARYNLDAPPIKQYWDYLVGVTTRFDLGWSTRLEDYSVNQVIAEGYPVSATLAIFALVFAIILGVTAGVISAVYRRTTADVALMFAAVLGIAIPNFVLASLAILLFVFIITCEQLMRKDCRSAPSSCGMSCPARCCRSSRIWGRRLREF